MTVAGAPVHEKVLVAASAQDATHTALFLPHYSIIRFFIVSGAGVASGDVQLEAALTPSFAGTWAAIGAALTVPAANAIASQTSANSTFPYVRARIGTVVAGGTIDVWIVAN